MSPRKQLLPDIIRLLHSLILYRLIETVTTHTKPAWLQTRQIPALGKSSRNKVPFLTMKLFDIDVFWKMKYPFSPMSCYWVYLLGKLCA